MPPFAAAAVAVATPGPSAVPTGGRARAAEDARAKAKAPIFGDRTRRFEGLPRSKIKPPAARAPAADSNPWAVAGGLHSSVTGEPTVAPKVRAAMKVAAAAEVEARAEELRVATAPSAGRPPMAREDEVSLRLPSEDTTAARPTAASEARRLPTQAEVEEAEFRREIAEEWVEVEVPPAAVTNGGDEGSTVPTLDPRAFKEDVKSLMAAHDDAPAAAPAAAASRRRPMSVSRSRRHCRPSVRGRRGGWHEPPVPPAPPDPPWQPPPPESPHYPKTLEDYARRNPAVEVGAPRSSRLRSSRGLLSRWRPPPPRRRAPPPPPQP